MKIAKDILARLFALWALLLFVVTLLIAFIPIAVTWLWKDPARTRIFHRISQAWMAFYLPLAGVWVVRKGKEYFEKGRTYILICNHNSMLDVPLTTPGTPSANKTIAKIEMAGIPLFGLIYKTGSVLVDRSSEESRRASFNQMKDVLQMGLHMCIYPEGTRNRTGEPLRPFHSGAFRLAAETGYEILPAVLFNTAKVLRNDRRFYFWPGVVKMHFLPPIPTAGQSAEQLRDRAFTLMKEYYERHAQ